MGCYLVACQVSAYGTVPATENGTQEMYQAVDGSGTGPARSSKLQACIDRYTFIDPATIGVLPDGTRCSQNGMGLGFGFNVSTVPAYGCGANSTLVGGACECSLGFKPNVLTNQCQPVDCPGELGFLGNSAIGGSGSSVCYAGCRFTGSMGGSNGGTNVVYGPFSWTPGAYCQGNGAGSPPVSTGSDTSGPSPCSRPLCPGTVNGASVCLPCGTSTTTGPSTSTTTPSGPASAPPGTQQGTSTTTTTCTAGSCNTTVTNYGPSGGGGGPGPITGQTTTTESEESYCARNPTAPICEEEGDSEFGGTCAGGFSCDGDAVQCAMARDQHVRNCRDLTPNSYTAVGETALGSPANSTVGGGLIGIGSSDINVGTGIIGSAINPFGAACPADVPLALGATTVVIPLASTCTALQTMGALLIAITALWCAAWLVKGR